MKKIPVNVTIDPELLKSVDMILKSHKITRSWFMQECAKALLELEDQCKAEGIKRLPTLEFKGGKEKGDCLAPSLLQVAGRKAGYGPETSKTMELAKR